MTPLLMIGALVNDAHAEAAIEFKTSGPVAIYVDGRPAAKLSEVRHRVGGLSEGVHQIEVRGRYGTAYKAEIDLPDDTVTYASWDGREVRVLRTAWLDEEAPAAPEVVQAPQAPAPPPVQQAPAPPPVQQAPAPPPVQAPVAQAPAPPPPVAQAPVYQPPQQPVYQPPPPPPQQYAQPQQPVYAPPPQQPVYAPPAYEVAAPARTVPDEIEYGQAAPAPAAVVAPPIATPRGRTVTVQASDGMKLKVVAGDKEILVEVQGDHFVISDASGLEFELAGE